MIEGASYGGRRLKKRNLDCIGNVISCNDTCFAGSRGRKGLTLRTFNTDFHAAKPLKRSPFDSSVEGVVGSQRQRMLVALVDLLEWLPAYN